MLRGSNGQSRLNGSGQGRRGIPISLQRGRPRTSNTASRSATVGVADVTHA